LDIGIKEVLLSNTPQNHEKMHFIDLFPGAGGLSAGFISTGFKPMAYLEIK